MVFGAMQSARLKDFLSLITFYNECPICYLRRRNKNISLGIVQYIAITYFMLALISFFIRDVLAVNYERRVVYLMQSRCPFLILGVFSETLSF